MYLLRINVLSIFNGILLTVIFYLLLVSLDGGLEDKITKLEANDTAAILNAIVSEILWDA